MNPFRVFSRAKTLNQLLKKAQRGTVVLETADGQRFALTAVHDWDAFTVGDATTTCVLSSASTSKF